MSNLLYFCEDNYKYNNSLIERVNENMQSKISDSIGPLYRLSLQTIPKYLFTSIDIYLNRYDLEELIIAIVNTCDDETENNVEFNNVITPDKRYYYKLFRFLGTNLCFSILYKKDCNLDFELKVFKSESNIIIECKIFYYFFFKNRKTKAKRIVIPESNVDSIVSSLNCL